MKTSTSNWVTVILFYPHLITHSGIEGKFLYNHYRAALKIKHSLTEELHDVCESLKVAEGNFELYLDQERKYLESLSEEPLETQLSFIYVEALDDLAQCH